MEKKLNKIYCDKKGIYYPNTVDEVQTLVYLARKKHWVIRTLGAEHSPSAAIHCQSRKQISISLSGELKKIHQFEPLLGGKYALVTVGAGCNLGHNPQDKTSTLENSFNQQIDKRGFALPTLGGISHQTIAGFLQTSSSGGTVKHGIADAILSFEIINGEGEWLQLKKGEDCFNAAAVAMGLMGIITQVTFILPKKFLVQGLEENKLRADSFLAQNSSGEYEALKNALFHEHEYVHLNWFAQKYLDRVMQWTGKMVDVDQAIKPYRHPLKSKLLTLGAALILKINNYLDYFAGKKRLAHLIKALLLKPFVNLNEQQIFCDHWHNALPIDDQTDVDGLINTAFSELWFPKEAIDTVMQRLQALFDCDPTAIGNFIVELYPAKDSPYWMSPAFERDSFRVDLYWWLFNKGDAIKYFSKFWQALIDIPGVRFHWGKYLPTIGETYGGVTFNKSFLQKQYPNLEKWLAIREGMDPEQIFVTDYWRKLFEICPVAEASMRMAEAI